MCRLKTLISINAGVVVIKAMVGFILGIIFSGSLFQLDLSHLGLYSSLVPNQQKILNMQQTKIEKAKSLLSKQRQNLFINSLKKAGKKTAGSLVPVLGTVLTIGFSAKDYCDDIEEKIEVINLLSGEAEKFNTERCIDEAKRKIKLSLG